MTDDALTRLNREIQQIGGDLPGMTGRQLAIEMRLLLTCPGQSPRAHAVLLEAMARVEGRRVQAAPEPMTRAEMVREALDRR